MSWIFLFLFSSPVWAVPVGSHLHWGLVQRYDSHHLGYVYISSCLVFHLLDNLIFINPLMPIGSLRIHPIPAKIAYIHWRVNPLTYSANLDPMAPKVALGHPNVYFAFARQWLTWLLWYHRFLAVFIHRLQNGSYGCWKFCFAEKIFLISFPFHPIPSVGGGDGGRVLPTTGTVFSIMDGTNPSGLGFHLVHSKLVHYNLIITPSFIAIVCL